jgi:hypothetical protein
MAPTLIFMDTCIPCYIHNCNAVEGLGFTPLFKGGVHSFHFSLASCAVDIATQTLTTDFAGLMTSNPSAEPEFAKSPSISPSMELFKILGAMLPH